MSSGRPLALEVVSMKNRESRILVVLFSAAVVVGVAADPGAADWPQWGGPHGDFKVTTAGLAASWPEGGPEQLWRRALGEGYSGIVAQDGRVYTMYRRGDEEIVVALDATSGETVWEHAYPVPIYPKQTIAYGDGPNATPLLIGGKIVTIGFTGVMQCLDAGSGSLEWSHDLVREFGGEIQYYGYSNSPIAYQNTVLTLVGGERHGAIAFAADSGKVVWSSAPTRISYAAPVLIEVDGQDQVVFFSPTEVIGIAADSGKRLWSHQVVNFCKTNCSAVIWGDDNLLWVATKGVGGTRVLRLSRQGAKTEVEQVWIDRKIRIYHWNGVRIGDHIYASIGDRKKQLAVIDIASGAIVDSVEGFDSTNLVASDGKLIALDAKGTLALVEVGPGRLGVRSQFKIFESTSWTAPTLVGRTLYLRDRLSIAALDIGPAAAKS